jgi:hypothetical protein
MPTMYTSNTVNILKFTLQDLSMPPIREPTHIRMITPFLAARLLRSARQHSPQQCVQALVMFLSLGSHSWSSVCNFGFWGLSDENLKSHKLQVSPSVILNYLRNGNILRPLHYLQNKHIRHYCSYQIASRSSVRAITPSPTTHHPLPDLYKGFRIPQNTFTLKMVTSMFVETLENLKLSLRPFLESLRYTLQILEVFRKRVS